MSLNKPMPGILIETSIAIRIKLKELDKKRTIIVADLDDHNLFVKEDQIEFIREEISKF